MNEIMRMERIGEREESLLEIIGCIKKKASWENMVNHTPVSLCFSQTAA